MKQLLFILFFITSCSVWAQTEHNKLSMTITKLQNFKKETKFEASSKDASYTGLANPEIKIKLSELLNRAADDFIATTNSKPSEKKYQEDIKRGISRFNPFYLDLDTEDREKICSYFEELMDCVELQSSGGELNKWLYGFDPTKKQ